MPAFSFFSASKEELVGGQVLTASVYPPALFSNSVPPWEPEKDLYLRTLYHVKDYGDFLNKFLFDKTEIYLTGGATWDMMFEKNCSLVKDLIPEDENTNVKSNYRVVPFQYALDTMEILKLIKKEENE